MGNVSYLIPKVNTDKFTLDNILKLIQDNFTKVNAQKIEGFEQIRVEFKNELVLEMWCEECYMLDNIDKNIEYCNTVDDYGLKDYLALKDAKLDKENSIGISYGSYYTTFKKRTEIIKLIGTEFKCYLLDEGIHPEHIIY